tara:strand:+ start:621 stop:941 length:321 start_codon:yes stop_codon:yes gene_type:complete
MNTTKIITASAIALLSSNIAFGGEMYDGNSIRVQLGSYTYSHEDRQLVKELTNTLQLDEKLSGQLEVSGKNGNIFISGIVDEVTMIYRVVEIVRRNSAVKNIRGFK